MAKYLVKQIFDSEIVTGYEIKQKTNARHLPRGGKHIFVEGVDTEYPKIDMNPESGSLSIIEDVKPKALKDAYKEMDDGIMQDGAAVFNSTSRTTMLASIDDFQLHVMAPELFTNDGEKTVIVTASFPSVKTPLNSEVDIKTYYSEVLYELLKKRRVKVKKYLDKKTELGL